MKVLLAANAPWSKTGYGTQGASLARRLRDAGHRVTYYCNYGLEGGVQEWEGITCLPSAGLGYVDPILKGHIRYTQPDLLITFHDLWPWQKTDLPDFIQGMGVKWLAWFPIDALPVSQANLDVLRYVDYPVAIANFVEQPLRDAGLDPVHVVPHGIEKAFGYTANGRREFRRLNLIPDDAFLFGSVGRNAYYPGRKGFDRLMRAFAEADLPNSYLYIHSTTNSESGSVPLPQVAEFYGITDRVRFADDYNGVMGYSQDGMNAIYSALDCYVQPTLGEGFGIPVLEAQACGAVVIATDCTSMPELLCPEASQLVPGITEIFTPDPAHRVLIDIEQLKASMAEVYAIKRDDPVGFTAMKGRAGLWANGWDWDRIWHECWTPLLQAVEADIERSPKRDWHRGGALVFEHEGRMRKQESALKSPVVVKELAVLDRHPHPNIIPVLARGTDADGTHWYDMPKYRSLRDVQPDALSKEQASRIVEGVRSALRHLHEAGVAHRDVCPENVVLDAEFNPYLIDFEWAGPCDGELCVDFEPWECIGSAVPVVQSGMEQRGFHTVVQYVKGIDLTQKRHGFRGVPYQAIDGVGERDCETRWKLMRPEVEGKRVLDVGCNLGWFVRRSLDEGAASATGIDFDKDVIGAAMKLGAGSYYPFDLDEADPYEAFGAFDVVFCLSVLQHLKDPDRTFDALLRMAKELYIEIPVRFVTPRMAQELSRATHVGESERGRPIYYLKVREAVAV